MRKLPRYEEIIDFKCVEGWSTVTQFAGDAVMAVFNAPVRQPDHALRAARAALAMQTAIDSIVSGGCIVSGSTVRKSSST